MKKHPKKTEGKSNPPLAVKAPEPNSQEQIPPGLEFLVGIKTPVELISALLPTVKNFDGLAAIFAGLDIDLQIKVPEWAKAAAKKFWQGFGLELTQSLADGKTLEIGKWIGFLEEIKLSETEPLNTERIEKFVNAYCAYARQEASNAAPEIAKKFFDERVSGKKLVNRAQFSPQRTKVFLFIAVAWRKVEEFQSAGEFHRFLLAEKIVLSMTEAAETRKICRSIGLKFESKAGRPLKKN